MSVILNEAALKALLDTQEGPVGRLVQRAAQQVVDAMKFDVKSYYRGAETGTEDDVDVVMDGSSAIVGLRNDPFGRHTSTGLSKAERYAAVGRWEKTHEVARS